MQAALAALDLGGALTGSTATATATLSSGASLGSAPTTPRSSPRTHRLPRTRVFYQQPPPPQLVVRDGQVREIVDRFEHLGDWKRDYDGSDLPRVPVEPVVEDDDSEGDDDADYVQLAATFCTDPAVLRQLTMYPHGPPAAGDAEAKFWLNSKESTYLTDGDDNYASSSEGDVRGGGGDAGSTGDGDHPPRGAGPDPDGAGASFCFCLPERRDADAGAGVGPRSPHRRGPPRRRREPRSPLLRPIVIAAGSAYVRQPPARRAVSAPAPAADDAPQRPYGVDEDGGSAMPASVRPPVVNASSTPTTGVRGVPPQMCGTRPAESAALRRPVAAVAAEDSAAARSAGKRSLVARLKSRRSRARPPAPAAAPRTAVQAPLHPSVGAFSRH
jgi:hypothetical protein